MADAAVLKTAEGRPSCGFESRRPHPNSPGLNESVPFSPAQHVRDAGQAPLSRHSPGPAMTPGRPESETSTAKFVMTWAFILNADVLRWRRCPGGPGLTEAPKEGVPGRSFVCREGFSRCQCSD